MRDGWRRLPLGDVAKLDVERVLVAEGRSYRAAGVLNEGKGLFVRETLSSTDTNYSHLHRLRAGQLVMRKLTAFEGSIGVVPADLVDHFVSPEFPTFTLDESELLPEYMALICKQPSFWHEMWLRSTGTVQRRKRVNPSALLLIEIQLPPIREQRRIIDLIRALDACAAVAAREAASARRLYSTLLRSEFEADLPRTALGEVATARLGKMLSKASKTGEDEQPYVRNADVRWDEVRLDGLSTMAFSREEREEFALRAGDVLVCEGGEVGRTAVLDRDLPGIYFQKAVHRVRCGPTLLPRYLLHFMRFSAGSGGFNDFSSGSTIQHLTGEKLTLMPIPQPPLGAQAAAIQLLDSVLSTVRAAETLDASASAARRALLTDLLSGSHEIPETYDALLGEVA